MSDVPVEMYNSGYRAGIELERERIINLMNAHRIVVDFGVFKPILSCNKCGDVTKDQPSHLMRLIKEGNK